MIASKLKQALICLRAGRVTMAYPLAPAVAEPVKPPEGFRGRMEIDVEKCLGCGGCAEVCPSRLITVHDPCQEKRILEYNLDRCTYCGRCMEVCPEDAITLTQEFENATEFRKWLEARAEMAAGRRPLGAGAHFLAKPFEPDAITRMVRQILDARRRPAAAPLRPPDAQGLDRPGP